MLVRVLASMALIIGGSAVAADGPQPGSLPILAPGSKGTLGEAGILGNDAKAQDSEAQLREIESTKRLMKTLRDMNAPPAGAGPGQAGESREATKAAEAPKAAKGGPEGGGPGLELPGAVASELREVASGVSQAARAVGLTGDPAAVAARDANRPNDGSPGATSGSMRDPEVMRTTVKADEGEVQAMLDRLIDEILPWAIGIGVLLALSYGIFSWAAARANAGDAGRRGSSGGRSGSRKRRSSRRGPDLRRSSGYPDGGGHSSRERR